MGPTTLPDVVLNKTQLGDTSATHPKSGSNLLELAAATAPRMKSVVVGPSTIHDPFVTVVPSLIKKLGGNTLEKLALEYLDEEEEDLEMVVANVSEEEDQDIDMEEKTDSDLEMLHDAPDVFKTPKKKRMVKVKEQIDDDFLRRSKRISQKLGGFKNTESAKMYTEAGNEKVKPSGSKSKKTKSSKKAKKIEGEPST